MLELRVGTEIEAKLDCWSLYRLIGWARYTNELSLPWTVLNYLAHIRGQINVQVVPQQGLEVICTIMPVQFNVQKAIVHKMIEMSLLAVLVLRMIRIQQHGRWILPSRASRKCGLPGSMVKNSVSFSPLPQRPGLRTQYTESAQPTVVLVRSKVIPNLSMSIK